MRQSACSENPYALSLLINKDGCNESKALLISVESMPTTCLLSIANFHSSVSLIMVVSQLCIFLYAEMLELRILSKC